jgi:hypothetical protein
LTAAIPITPQVRPTSVKPTPKYGCLMRI